MRGRMVGVALAALGVSGCASMALSQYVGRSLDDMAHQYGPPTDSMRLPDGSTAFRWVFGATKSPETTTPLSMFMPIAAVPLDKRRAASRNGPLGGMCTYTVRARWNTAEKVWRITGYDTPRADCN